jgi:hypothetical protein
VQYCRKRGEDRFVKQKGTLDFQCGQEVVLNSLGRTVGKIQKANLDI